MSWAIDSSSLRSFVFILLTAAETADASFQIVVRRVIRVVVVEKPYFQLRPIIRPRGKGNWEWI
jgi:hypothetical protein